MKEFTTFETLLKPLTENLIEEVVKRFNADYYSKTFKTSDHLAVMIYAQLHDLKSLRDIEIAFNNQEGLKKKNISPKISRSTLSDGNAKRPADCFLWLSQQLMTLLPKKPRQEVNKVVKQLDSSPIQLKGNGYDEWTRQNRTLRCQGVKLHIEYDGQLNMPTGVKISTANVDDCSVGQRWPIVSNTVYVFDKGYCDFNWWWSIEQKGAFFVTRLKKNAAIKIVENNPCNNEEILEDNLFIFKNKIPRGRKSNLYNKPLRRIVIAREGKTPLVIVSNLMELPAKIIAELYKERWGIELFFKWIKQNLRIKKFLGKSENAVKIQIAIALITYILIGLFKLSLKNKLSMHQLLIWIKHNWSMRRKEYILVKPPDYKFIKLKFGFNYSGGY